MIRFRLDAKTKGISLGSKFGCNPNDDAIHLIQCTRDLGLELHGFSFHPGSPCEDPAIYVQGIHIARRLINVARSMNCNNVRVIDIGGGFPAGDSYPLSPVSI